jgi:RNA polymerase sigma-70 factor (ECF subfamily)
VDARELLPGFGHVTDMDCSNDTEVLRGSLDDPSLFAVLYERHLPTVHRYLRRRVGDGSASDLSAEVFVRAFRARSRYAPRHETARPWLLGIANHVISEHRRYERRRLATMQRIAVAGEWAANDRISADLAPEVARALKRLRAADRDALLLVVWGELSYAEAADALDVPVGTIRSRIARARGRLAVDLDDTSVVSAICTTGEEHA